MRSIGYQAVKLFALTLLSLVGLFGCCGVLIAAEPGVADATHQTPRTFYLGSPENTIPPVGLEQQIHEYRTSADVTQVALNTIQTNQALVQTVLTAFSAIIGIVAIFGYLGIRNGAISRAEQIANKRVDSYILSDEFEDKLRTQTNAVVDDIVRERVKDLLLTSARDSDAEQQAPRTESNVEPWRDT